MAEQFESNIDPLGDTTAPDELDREAYELYCKFKNELPGRDGEDLIAKQCAIICVDYLIKEVPIYSDSAYKYTTIKQKIEQL